MKKDRLLNPGILTEIASLGHTEYLCIADCGLPIPKETRVVDVSVVAGLPRFADVLEAVNSELVIESAIVASEIHDVNPEMMKRITQIVGDIPISSVPHEDFKKLLTRAKCVIRTGETSSYANVILVGGVNF